MIKLFFSEIRVLKGLIFFYMIIFISLYIVINVLLDFSVSVNGYMIDVIDESTKNMQFEVSFDYSNDTDLSEFAEYISYGDKKLIYDSAVLNKVTLSDGMNECTADGTETSFIYGIRGITNFRFENFIKKGRYPDILAPENNNRKLWISSSVADKNGFNADDHIILNSENMKNSYDFVIEGIYRNKACDSDFLISYDTCLEMLEKEGFSTRAKVTVYTSSYKDCGKLIAKLQTLDIDGYCYLYDYVSDEIGLVRLLTAVLLCISFVVAIASAFISSSMSQIIILRRSSAIALYKMLGLTNTRIKRLYFAITYGIIVLSCVAAYYPSKIFTYSLINEYCGLFGLIDLKIILPIKMFPFTLLVCSVFTLLGFLKVFSAVDHTSELEIVRSEQ